MGFNSVFKGLMFSTIIVSPNNKDGPGSSVGIATGYGVDGPVIESRWE